MNLIDRFFLTYLVVRMEAYNPSLGESAALLTLAVTFSVMWDAAASGHLLEPREYYRERFGGSDE